MYTVNTEVGAVQRRFPFLFRPVKYPDVIVLAIADAVRRRLAVTSSSW